MNERDAIYIQILHHGLLRLRDAAATGHTHHCSVEAEHLHNIPSLVGETNEHRHACYLGQERCHYLEHIDRSLPGLEFTLSRYAELWERLAKLHDTKAV